jgi:hypothetical protein
LLLAGTYDLRSEDDDGLTEELLLDGRELLEGRTVLDGLELLDGLALLDGLEDGADADIPADAGLFVVPATCNPPWPLGLGLVIGARPPPGCGLCPCPGLYDGYEG